ncbi:MAG: hypothetical protein EOL92_00465 [Bacteroidia bacterium]|nr:hypothetical protein [Bacteroidia bacterium]
MIDTLETLIAALDDFGTAATINGGSESLDVIFTENQTSVGGDMVENLGPMAIASSADVASLDLRRGDTLFLGTMEYTVLSLDPDGHGGTVIALEAQ